MLRNKISFSNVLIKEENCFPQASKLRSDSAPSRWSQMFLWQAELSRGGIDYIGLEIIEQKKQKNPKFVLRYLKPDVT